MKKQVKKLKLAKETVRSLESQGDLRDVVGGLRPPPTNDSCPYSSGDECKPTKDQC